MRIAITGASGFVGSALCRALSEAGDEPVPLVRHAEPPPGSARWDPVTGELERTRLAGLAAIVHLAAENIAAGRWTDARRRRLRDSRVPATQRLCEALAAWPERPPVLVSASAVGIHGDRGDEWLDDSSAPGTGFLADLARGWEAATAPAAAAGIRVVNLRIGVVLGRGGGALQRMLLPFRLGLGGRLGNGRQWLSWIALPDLVAAIRHCIVRPGLRGPVLAVAPEPCTNRDFTRALGRALHRPAVLPVPAFALRCLFGSMADEALLASQRARPQRLLADGFRFALGAIDRALPAVLGG